MNIPPKEKPVCIATNHAYDRAKERLRWKKSVLEKMMVRAYQSGFQHKHTNGALKKYLDHLWKTYKTSNNVRIYGENVFFFKDNLLITIYRLDNRYIKHLVYLRENLNATA